MKFTNRLDLPQPLVDLIVNDDYTKGDADYSITELFDSPRRRRLMTIHDDEIVIDVSDRLYALYGKLIHKLLENAEKSEMSEERYFVELGGKRISGQVDRFIYHRGLLQDYKFVGVYKFQGGVPADYEEQINGYYYLLHRNQLDVRAAEIVTMFRDWKKGIAVRKSPEEYPQGSVIKPRVTLYPMSYTEKLLLTRIELHEKAKTELPLCTRGERWKDPDIWAVVPSGKKRAVAKYFTKQEAEEHKTAHGGGYDIEHRVFEAKRCNLFCEVCKWCDQYREES